jgi:transcriptional regulator with XRE-family HTH domain
MVIGDRLRVLRRQKNLSQGDIEERTGLLRCYISRVENGHTVPAIETLEKFARALDTPLYQLLYEGEDPPGAARESNGSSLNGEWGSAGRAFRYLNKLRELLARMNDDDRELLMSFVCKVTKLKHGRR